MVGSYEPEGAYYVFCGDFRGLLFQCLIVYCTFIITLFQGYVGIPGGSGSSCPFLRYLFMPFVLNS